MNRTFVASRSRCSHLLAALAALLCAEAQAAGISCKSASSKAEHMICATPSLVAIDRSLADRYRAASADSFNQAVLAKQQQAWLAQRDQCTNVPCLHESYVTRIAELEALSFRAPHLPAHLAAKQDLLPGGKPWRQRVIAALPIEHHAHEAYATVIDDKVVFVYLAREPHENGADGAQYFAEFEEFGAARILARHERQGQMFIRYDDVPAARLAGRLLSFWDFPSAESASQNAVRSWRYVVGSGEKPQSAPLTLPQQAPESFPSPDERYQLDAGDYSYSLSLIDRQQGEERISIADFSEDSHNGEAWRIGGIAWQPDSEAVYFDNSGSTACIWRYDINTRNLQKIVPDHEAKQPFYFEFHGRPYVLYVQGNLVSVATP